MAETEDGQTSGRPRPDLDRLHFGQLRDWAQLVRLPNVFTLFSDCVAAAVVIGSQLLPVSAFVLIVLASLCAYWAGMILNDVVDLEEDRQSRPERPLAAGRISPVAAGHVANGMLLIGPLLILLVTTVHSSQPLWMGAGFASAVLLSICVRSYDSPLKRTPLGPPLMGVCRGLNILMVGCTMFAISGSAVSASTASGGEQLPRELPIFAAAIGLYIFGVTVFARREERESSPVGLSAGLLLELAGLVLIASLPYWSEDPPHFSLEPNRGYPLLIGLIGVTVARRGISAILHPVPRKVQLAVKHAILTLILIDAAVALMWGGTWFGIGVIMLLIPALSSAIRFRST